MTALASRPPLVRRPGPPIRAGRRDQKPRLSRDLPVQASGFILVLATWLSLLGPVGPLLMMLGMAGLIALAPRPVVLGLVRCWPVLVVGAIAMLSSLWSTAPGISLRFGTQLAITLVAAIVLASSLTPARLLRIFFLTSFVVMILCILSGRQGNSTSGPVLIGILGSKNEMGALSQLLVLTGACLAFQKQEIRAVRLLALLGVLVGGVTLMLGFATGAVLSTILFAGLAAVFVIGSKQSPGAKVVLAFVLLLVCLPLLLIWSDLMGFWEYFVVDVLHKDMGLTGRDYLWAHADRLIAERPLLGYGYRSTWLGESADTIGLLRWAGLSTGAGFNFHDTYREWAVDFGLAGAVVCCLCFGFGFVRTIIRAFTPALTPALAFFAGIAVLSIIRAKVELLIGPFNSSALLFTCAAAIGFLYASPAVGRPVGRTALRARPAARPSGPRRPAIETAEPSA